MNQGQLNELTTRFDKLMALLERLLPIERQDPMKDEMYIALRSYLEEHSSMLRQILDEVKKQNASVATPSPELQAEAEAPLASATTKTQGGKPKAKPAVNWNS